MFKIASVGKTISVILMLLAGCVNAANQNTATTAPAETKPLQVQKPAATDSNNTSAKTETSSATVFFDKCVFIFKDFVNDKGMVNYRMLKKKKSELTRVLYNFNKLDPNLYNGWSKEDKIAFWINAYNLQMLNIIVDNYPIESNRIFRLMWPPDSIRHIQGIWTDYKFIVMDEEFTLMAIDQRFFRKDFNEPRVFLAVTHASLSSPPLRNEPYYGYKLSVQLDDQTRKFLSNPLAFKIDREKQKVYLSAIFEQSWHGQYFIEKYGTDKKFKEQTPVIRAILNFVIHYIPEQDVNYLETANYTVEYMGFNWRLNEQQ